MRAVLFVLKLGLKILAAPLVLALMLFTWVCFGLLYVSSFIFGLASTMVALLGIAVLVTYSPQNGVILLVIAFLVSPLGLPMAAAWLVGKVQTMVDSRTNFAKEIAALLRETYGSKIKVFGTEIPHSVRAKETSAEGKSIFAHDPGGKVAEGYRNLT